MTPRVWSRWLRTLGSARLGVAGWLFIGRLVVSDLVLDFVLFVSGYELAWIVLGLREILKGLLQVICRLVLWLAASPSTTICNLLVCFRERSLFLTTQ